MCVWLWPNIHRIMNISETKVNNNTTASTIDTLLVFTILTLWQRSTINIISFASCHENRQLNFGQSISNKCSFKSNTRLTWNIWKSFLKLKVIIGLYHTTFVNESKRAGELDPVVHNTTQSYRLVQILQRIKMRGSGGLNNWKGFCPSSRIEITRCQSKRLQLTCLIICNGWT
jgi:hypothetical protein